MAPRKLSDSDKSEIIELYKQPGQTTTTLAEQFGVSSSTVSRILKSTIPPDDYRELISQKRMASSDKVEPASKPPAAKAQKKPAKKTPAAAKQAIDEQVLPKLKTPDSEAALADTADTVVAEKAVVEKPGDRRRRRRSQAQAESDEQLPLLGDDGEGVGADSPAENRTASPMENRTATGSDDAKDSRPKPTAPILASAEDDDDDDDDDDLVGLDETLGDDFGDDDDLEDEDDDEDDEVDVPKPKRPSQVAMSIMPLGDAVLPKPCYLVVDMRSELITRPLSEFSDLGKVPASEEQSKTLPVFDNHRVARRFSRNKQRVIKVPDGNLITRTSPYLQAKGITRLMVDGQVFDLAGID